MNSFTNDANIRMLWDILLDQFHFIATNNNLVQNVRNVFEKNIRMFILKINPKSSIMELNKQFLSQVVLAVNILLSDTPKKITIFPEEENIYKIEDIQASRLNTFEKQFEMKKQELDTYLTPQKPNKVDFSDNNTEDKIYSMDALIAEKIAERNENIQLDNTPIDWLTPKETSIKPVQQKKVSWEDNGFDIFNKLKKQTIYDEQQSILLPEVKQEEIITPKNILPEKTIVPMNEMTKMLNGMNTNVNNIDNKLDDCIDKITNSINNIDKIFEVFNKITNSIDKISNSIDNISKTCDKINDDILYLKNNPRFTEFL